jgi:hypothetical protein
LHRQSTIPVVGFLGGGSPDSDANRARAFHQGLSEAGYVEGKNVAIEYRWAEAQYDRFSALATDLVRHQVNVIAALGGAASTARSPSASHSMVGSGPDFPHLPRLEHPESCERYVGVRKRVGQLALGRVDGLVGELKRSVVVRKRQLGSGIPEGHNGFLRVHVLLAHEPPRLVGPDREHSQPDGSVPLRAAEMPAIAIP